MSSSHFHAVVSKVGKFQGIRGRAVRFRKQRTRGFQMYYYRRSQMVTFSGAIISSQDSVELHREDGAVTRFETKRRRRWHLVTREPAD
jgi:hypothetical protein